MNIKSVNLYVTTLLLFVLSCKKETETSPTNSKPQITISSIRPTNGPYNTLDTIVGTNFSNQDSVWIDGVMAQVISISQDTIIVKVPKITGNGAITITGGGTTVTGPNFNYVFTATVSTLAGNGTYGFADGKGSSAEFMLPTSIVLDAQGNLFVAETQGHRIRKVTPDGVVSTFAGNGIGGWLDGPAMKAKFYYPYGIVFDAAGNLYVGDTDNGLIRQITPAGIVNTLSGDGQGFVSQPTVTASFTSPLGLAIDSRGLLYVADANMVKSITSSGIVDTVAGTDLQGYVDGLIAVAEFKAPAGLAFDGTGNLYIADTYNSVIRKFVSTGQVSTFAGNGIGGFLDSTSANAEFLQPQAVVADSEGNIYVGDYANARVRKISKNGIVSTVAGTGKHGYIDGTTDKAEFYSPWGLAIDLKGNIYVADSRNSAIRKISFE